MLWRAVTDYPDEPFAADPVPSFPQNEEPEPPAEESFSEAVTDETPEAPGDSTGLPHESPLPEATDPEPQSHAEEERRPLPPLPIAHGWLEDDAVLEGQLEDLTQAAVSQGAPEKGSPAPLRDIFDH